MKYKLIRESDGLTIEGSKIAWIEWGEYDTAVASHNKIEVGLSLLVDPQRVSYTWLTTVVTEVLEESEELIKFRTKNSTYELRCVE